MNPQNNSQYKEVLLSNLHQTKKISIPNSWDVKKISEISSVNPQQINEKYPHKEILYIDIGAIREFQIQSYEKLKLNERPSRAQRLVQENDILVSTVRPYLKGFTKITKNNPNLICSTGFAVIRAKTSKDVDYIFNYFQGYHFLKNCFRLMEGISYPAISSKIVGDSLIPYPDNVKEREKIGKILSNVSEVIQNIVNLEKQFHLLKKGIIQKLLDVNNNQTKSKDFHYFFHKVTNIPDSFEIENAGKLLKIIDYRGRTPPFSDSGIPHLRSNNIRDNTINSDDLAFVSQETYNEYMTRGIPQENDLLFTTEGPLGEVALVPKNFKFSLAQRLIVLRPKSKKILTQYLQYILLNDKIRRQYFAFSTGSTLGGISSKWFKKLLIPYPKNIKEQEKIASTLSNIDNAIQKNQLYKSNLVLLKKGLMQNLLTGKLRINF